MNFDHRNPRLRRGFAFVALAAVLGLSAVGLTQCRMVDDTVTGVDVRSNTGFSNGRSACVHQCNEKYKACKRAEDARHKAAVQACGGDNSCKKAENTLHKNNHKQCVVQMQLCKKNCRYREGAGNAGR
jgi:hypothetical protein